MGDKPGPDRQVTDMQILKELRNHYSPAMNAAEIAKELPVARQTIDKRLRSLADEGFVNTRKVGTVRVWWLSDDGKYLLHENRTA